MEESDKKTVVHSKNLTSDVLVAGGGISGISAALAAAPCWSQSTSDRKAVPSRRIGNSWSDYILFASM